MRVKDVILLFDVDGTLTLPRQKISDSMYDFIIDVYDKVPCALVGGSDLSKIAEQMGGLDNLMKFDYVFTENGLMAFEKGQLLAKRSILDHKGEESLQKLINFCLHYMSTLKLPCKRGNFVEFRTGLINVSPIGRSCSQEERNQFAEYDKEHKIRETFVEALKKEFPDEELYFAIGGQISIDVFPVGWDKTYCLQFMENSFQEIHFFGDKTFPGGNDYEIYSDPRTVGHNVTSPDDTRKQVEDLLSVL